MDNQLLPERKFWQSKRFYIGIGIFALFSIAFFTFIGSNNFNDYAWGYAHKPIFEKALEAAKNNAEVTAKLGNLEPIGNMTIAEGQITMTKKGFTATITVKGSKGKGKMDIRAHQDKDIWAYNYIYIRIKEPNQTIPVELPEPVMINEAAH